jgi:DNA polymerase-3 subunit delta
MIKLISGTDQYVVSELIEKDKETLGVNPVFFDATERNFDLGDVLFELISLDLFNPKKLVVIKNALFLSSKSKLSETDEQVMNEIIKNDSDDVMLILTLNGLKFDSKKKIVKSLKAKGELIFLEDSQPQSIKQALNIELKKNNININQRVFEHLTNLVPSYQAVHQAIEKLALYDGEITMDVIDHLIVDESELVLFDLSNALIEKRISDSLRIYAKLKRRNIDTGGLIYILASKVRQMYQAMVLKQFGYTQSDVARALSISPNYAWVLMNRLNNYLTPKDCLKLLHELALYDQKTKFYVLDRHLEFELWMINYGREYGKS